MRLMPINLGQLELTKWPKFISNWLQNPESHCQLYAIRDNDWWCL